jgi:outer membrane biosynthesis protein TonB
MSDASHIMQQYRQPLWGHMEPALRNCFVGAGALGLIALLVLLLVPIPALTPVTVTEVPERIARLILQKPEAPAAKQPGQRARQEAKPAPQPEAPPVAQPRPEPRTPGAPPARRAEPPRVSADRGVEGRARATREVTQTVASVAGSLDKVLENIATQVPASRPSGAPGESSTGAARGRRGVRAGRASSQIASVGGVSALSSADLSGSAITDRGVTIGMITGLAGGDGSGGAGASPGDAAGGAAGVGGEPAAETIRSNESLLAVVRRYAAGIQFCYDNELRKKPGLRGKLVVSMVVLANGSVSEAAIVEDTLNSPAVRECALAQIRGWQFPAIASGTTRFKTPFIFTPPSQ